jgi:Na+/serine symporter
LLRRAIFSKQALIESLKIAVGLVLGFIFGILIYAWGRGINLQGIIGSSMLAAIYDLLVFLFWPILVFTIITRIIFSMCKQGAEEK